MQPALATAAPVLARKTLPAAVIFELARVYSLAAAATPADADQLAESSLQLLRAIPRARLREMAESFQELQSDDDFAPLRGRPGYDALLQP